MLLKLLRPGKFGTRPIEGGVSELYKTNINNSYQWVMARGHSKDLPVLLMLHGGPGFTDMWLSEHANAELEKHFIVVNWDQRSSGKSYDKKADPKLLTIDQFVDDAKKVVDHLLDRFGKKKLYLFGHSWGTVLGWRLTSEIPEKLEHYISLGQVVNSALSEQRSYDFSLAQAKKEGNKKAMKELEGIFMPAPNDGKDPFGPLMVQRKWLAWYGGMIKGHKKLTATSKYLMGAKEYSFMDMLRFNSGMKVCIEQLWSQLLELNFMEGNTDISVPTTFIIGKNDRTVNKELSRDLFEKINAPSKNLIEIDAAHLGNITAVDQYAKAIKQVVN